MWSNCSPPLSITTPVPGMSRIVVVTSFIVYLLKCVNTMALTNARQKWTTITGSSPAVRRTLSLLRVEKMAIFSFVTVKVSQETSCCQQGLVQSCNLYCFTCTKHAVVAADMVKRCIISWSSTRCTLSYNNKDSLVSTFCFRILAITWTAVMAQRLIVLHHWMILWCLVWLMSWVWLERRYTSMGQYHVVINHIVIGYPQSMPVGVRGGIIVLQACISF